MAFGIASNILLSASASRLRPINHLVEDKRELVSRNVQASEVSEVYLPFVCFAEPPTTISRAGGTMGPDPRQVMTKPMT
jgi:hypothetical protein